MIYYLFGLSLSKRVEALSTAIPFVILTLNPSLAVILTLHRGKGKNLMALRTGSVKGKNLMALRTGSVKGKNLMALRTGSVKGKNLQGILRSLRSLRMT